MIKVGDRVPTGTFRVKNDDGIAVEVSTDELFAGQKVVLVGVPGAFTSTCHNSHIPQFAANVDAINAAGVDRIDVMAVNDHHVMKSWSEALGAAGKIDFLADGNGDYTRALGLEVDLTGGGLGMRCKRFSALIEDGVLRSLNFEPEGGKGISETGAAVILQQI
jgi:peroxiredoxin